VTGVPTLALPIWGLGIGDRALGPIPNPQSPIPNPQSPIPNPHLIIYLLFIFIFLNNNYYQIFLINYLLNKNVWI
jgi:hypothetical protein